MTREVMNRLLVVAGLALILVAGVVLPLRVAQALQAERPLEARSAPLQATEVLTTDVASTTVPTLVIDEPEATDAFSPAATVSSTVEPTVTVSPTVEPAVTVSPTVEPIVVASPTVTAPTPQPTELSPTEIPTPVPTAAPTGSPAPTSVPTDTPETPVTPTPEPGPTIPVTWPEVVALLTENWLLATVGCGILLFLFLGVLLIMLGLRRRKPKPPPPPPSPAAAPGPPVVSGPYLEGVITGQGPRSFELKPEGTTIGRGPDSDLVITQDFAGWDTVSRTHARVYQEGGRWLVHDLDSRNGVWVNGRRTSHNLLQDEWKLGIGKVEFVFRAGPGEAK